MYFNGLIFVKPMEFNFDGVVAYFLLRVPLWGNISTILSFFVQCKLYSCWLFA